MRLPSQWSGWLSNLAVLSSLAGIAYWGHETDWTFTKWAHHGPTTPASEAHPETSASDSEPMNESAVELDSVADVFAAGIRTTRVRRLPMAEFLTVPAFVTYVPSGVANLSARVPGTVWRVERRQGDHVKQGEVLAILDALAVGDAKAAFLQGLVQVELKDRNYQRLLEAGEGVAERFRREASAALREAQLQQYNARQTLINLGLPITREDFTGLSDPERARQIQFLGIPESIVADLDPLTTTANLIPVIAPFDGVLVRCEIVKGEVVSPERSPIVLANVERMLLRLNVNKEDALRVAEGQPVMFAADGIPGEIPCQIRWISTEVDDKTRAVQAIAEVENPRTARATGQGENRLLKANTFGLGRIRVREAQTALAVPETAVQWTGTEHVVFLVRTDATTDGENDWTFEPRRVEPGTTHDGWTEIFAGLSDGERIVADGSHALKSELTRRLATRGSTVDDATIRR